MADGFLGYDASLMLDVVVCALVLVVPALVYALYLVKVRHDYAAHRNLQLAIAAVLLVAVVAFEIDLQIVHGGWEKIVNKPDRPPRLTGEALAQARQVLRVHLVFAISTPLLWAATIGLALRRFPSPPRPGTHSRLHKMLGWLATVDLVLTSATGLAFYYMAFVRP